jgi:hypothetical protein
MVFLVVVFAAVLLPARRAGVSPRRCSPASPARRSRCLMVAPPPEQTSAYGAEQITVLEGLEPVRKRPGMYIGSTGPGGLHHLVYEVVDNSIDEALAGHATRVDVRLCADGAIEVTDDGRGIPCDVHAKTGRPALETVLTVLHAGGKFGDSGYKVSAGLHGVGVSVVNALSTRMDVAVRRSGLLHTMRFERGRVAQEMATAPLPADGSARSGTCVRFQPDETIFRSGTAFDFETLATRFDEQAYLNAGLNITLYDERRAKGGAAADAADAAGAEGAAAGAAAGGGAANGARVRVFCHEGGIVEYVNHICASKTPLLDEPPILSAASTVRGVDVDITLRWNADMYSDTLLGFANGVHTPQGGSHVDGLKSAVTRVLNAQARAAGKLKEKAPNLSGDFLREGLCAADASHTAHAPPTAASHTVHAPPADASHTAHAPPTAASHTVHALSPPPRTQLTPSQCASHTAHALPLQCSAQCILDGRRAVRACAAGARSSRSRWRRQSSRGRPRIGWATPRCARSSPKSSLSCSPTLPRAGPRCSAPSSTRRRRRPRPPRPPRRRATLCGARRCSARRCCQASPPSSHHLSHTTFPQHL